ncbi:family 43 glycosylhydrolase [Leeuwenhoekiella parthenopeia]|uniref:Family 43 glycosylhydrolase n=1 Tax=Leeuwenhoekiella parthenopeia TaxID=2890320 RepID=A0ABS8GMV9_9FLAO|nr:family 43 glycosylhydrolase [Leeuwenhoekiella parthenopeia]MCC4211250.1 family 43 glycosylhydrolase [Leeuwenhoekiella parthenopeia]
MFKKLLFIALSFAFSVSGFSQKESIRNGVSWFDTDGNRISAHGASILQHDGVYYMLGQDYSNDFFTIGVNLYSSTDLVNWTFLNKVIDATTNPEIASQQRITVRPNLVYNEATDRFIIWSGWKNRSLTYGAIAIFSSPTVDGNYAFEKIIEPLGYDSNDSTLFVDTDNTAYYISNNKDNRSLNIYKLTPDYMDLTGDVNILFAGTSKEAPVLFKKDGYYYLLNSYKTGWDPNEGQYAYTTSIMKQWSSLRNFGNRITYDTQPTAAFSVTGSEGTSYFYMGDRWKDPDLRESKNIILPIEASFGNLSLKYVPELKIDMEKGTWSAYDDNVYVPNNDWRVITVSSEQNNTTFSSSNVFDNNVNTIWNTNYTNGIDSYPHEMIIDLGNNYDVSGFMCVPRQDRSPNLISDFQLYLSMDGENWGKPVASGRMSYWSELYFPVKNAKYMKLVGRSDIFGTRFASAAEFRLMMNSEDYEENGINSYYNINGGSFSVGTKIGVDISDTVRLGPQAQTPTGQTQFYGSWSYHGPKDYYFEGRAPFISDIESDDLGQYTVYYLDDKFNVQTKNIEIGLKLKTKLIEVSDVVCNGDATGSASIEVMDGFAPYTYEWSNGQKMQQATDLSAGEYTVAVTDASGYTITENIKINEPEALQIRVTENAELQFGYESQCVTLEVQSVTGGSGNYSYLWSTGEISKTIEVCPTETTIYTVLVTDEAGCTISESSEVTVEDVRCTQSSGMTKILLCYKGKTLCVAKSAVPALVENGALIGSCTTEDPVEIEQLSIYPNPTSDLATVSVNSVIANKGSLTIYDMLGTIIYESKIKLNAGENAFEIDLSQQKPGVYIAQIRSANLEPLSAEIIKN